MKAHELLKEESNWCRQAYARDRSGRHIQPDDPEAVRWCLVGAIHRCYGYGNESLKILNRLGFERPAHWNDSPKRRFQEVRELLLRLDV